ncbi:MAG: dihydrolipoamide dehydrogenase [Desulforhopalus sp.]|jgi:dihydrolipoamide dehydrogenase
MVMGDMVMKVDVVVIGGGPGGYSAALRAANLGLDVTLVDSRPHPGGAYLHDECIPAKTLLSLVQILDDAKNAQNKGIHFTQPKIDLPQLLDWKKSVVENLASELNHQISSRGIQLIHGTAFFENSTTVRLKDSEISRLKFKHAIIATGSTPKMLPASTPPSHIRILTSADALTLTTIPDRMLIVGGGCVGVEIGTIYQALGATIHLIEQKDQILPDIEEDLTEPLRQKLSEQFERIMLRTTINKLIENEENVQVELQTTDGTETNCYDRVIVAIGRKPVTHGLGLENTGVQLDEWGFIQTDMQQRTAEPHIYAVGDVTNSTMRAHTAIRQGEVAAEVIAGQSSAFDVRAIPNVVYTNPQIAWCGLSAHEAAKLNIPVTCQEIPWKYSIRANTMGATEGLTKIISSEDDGRILGAAIVGCGAETLISEWVLAIEMGALIDDMSLCLHPSPTLSEPGSDTSKMRTHNTTQLLQ